MGTITKRDPFAVPTWDDMVRRMFREPAFENLPATDENLLALDISEDEKNVFVRASLPGYRREDVNVEVHEGVLSIQAQRVEEHEEKKEKFYRRERRMGSVHRRVVLPTEVLDGEIKANLKDGALTLTLPKSPATTPKKIAID